MMDQWHTEITVFEKHGGVLSKRIWLDADGKICSDGRACVMGHGTARRAKISDIHAYASLVNTCGNNKTPTFGQLKKGLPAQVDVVTTNKLNGRTEPNTIARTKEFLVFEQGQGGLAPIDFDPKGMSVAVKQHMDECGGLLGALCEVLPALEAVAMVRRPSTSSGLRNSKTGETFPHSGGEHLVIAVLDAADIPRFLSALHDRLWLAGFGWGVVSASGGFLERSPVDIACGSPERFFFEATPIVVSPLVQDPRLAVAYEGTVLDTRLCKSLNPEERAKLQELKAAEKQRLFPKRQAARAAWSTKHIQSLVARGVSEADARAQVDRWIDHRELTGAFELPFDKRELAGTTVADVLADPDRFIDETMADPHEGPPYGRGKAILYRRTNGSLFIHSFAHGGMTYELKPPLPVIYMKQGEIPRIVNETEDALLRLSLELYQYGDLLVEADQQLIKASGGREFLSWRLAEVTVMNLVEYFSNAATFLKFDKRSKGGGAWVQADPPEKIVRIYLDRKKKRVSHIAGIVNTPFLRADGTICDREGYDPATAVLCKWDGVPFPPVPLNPTKDDALAALKVLEKPLAEFPFVTPADKSAALSGILTPLDRKGVDIVPAHGYTAPAPGTGKGLLEDVVAMIATGRPMPSDNQGPDEEKQEKRLGASLIAGDSLIGIDNCERPIEGALLASAVTQHIVVVRVLGETRKVRCPNITCIYVNGNNLIIGADMTRRVIRCEMDAKCERPETREFKDSRLLDTVRANRAQLVLAGLTILRAWLVARPTTTIALTPLDFVEWSARTRSALVWLGCADPGDTMQASRANDPHQVERSVVFAEWNWVIGSREVLVRDIIVAASGDPPLFPSGDPALFAALMAVAAARNGKISPERLGTWLSKNKGKIADGSRLVWSANTNKGPTWRVEKV